MNYQRKAKRRHGVHSPFVYELTDKCFRIPVSAEYSDRMKSLNQRLGNNPKTLEITDHGAGSKKLGTTRNIGAIYKNSSSKGKYGKMLFQLMRHYKLERALELGTSLGIGTTCLATGNEDAEIVTIEGCPNTHKEAIRNFEALNIKNIDAKSGTFIDVIPELPEKKFDLIFIDGHHDGDALLKYVESLLPLSHDETFFILDDIRWSKSMKNAWETLVEDARFHVSIDLFRMGMVLRRPQQEKEHFTIKL